MNNTTYSTGTVSVGASSTTLTGTGTAWLTNGIRAGDVLLLAGLMVVIATVNSNTSITLKRGWPGAAQSAANYDILMLDDEVRSLTAANALLGSLSGGTLSSLAGLSSAANKMAYFTGSGVMAIADLTAQGRTLMGQDILSRSLNNLVTATDARFTGGAVTQSNTDTTAGRLLKVADFGLGGTQILFDGSVDDNTLPTGFYFAGASATGTKPFGKTFGHLLVTRRLTGERVFQEWVTDDGRRFSRNYSSSAWTAWREVYNHASILGTVSQSAGVPTGAVIERGSNANGYYTRFADGTQICFGSVLTSTSAGVSWTFPATFSVAPQFVIGSANTTSGRVVNVNTLTTTSAVADGWDMEGVRRAFAGQVFAVGRWF